MLQGVKLVSPTIAIQNVVAETVDTAANIGSSAADIANGVNQSKVANIQADLADIRAEMTLDQSVIDKLKEEIENILQGFQELMEIIMQMIQAKGETMQTVLNRPATV